MTALAPMLLSFRDQELLSRAARGIVPVPVRTVTATEPLRVADGIVLADATAGAITLTLPQAEAMRGRVLTIKKRDNANNVVVDGYGAETVDGAASVTLTTQYQVVTVVSDGAAWHVV